MARRSTAEILEEFHRLSDVLDAVWGAGCRIEPTLRRFEGHTQCRRMLASVDESDTSVSALIQEDREALSDMSPRGSSHPSEAARASRFLREDADIIGLIFWSDYPKPKAQLKAIRARGSIADNTEARLVQDRLSDADEKSGPKEKERLALEALFAAFGASELPTDD